MMRNMAGMMKKVQEMQERIESLQQEMASTEFSASVGGGSVTITVTGKGEMRACGSTWPARHGYVSMLEDRFALRPTMQEPRPMPPWRRA